MINPMDLTGKHIIVTGASQGIGKETALHIAKLGAKVSLIARSEDKLQSVKVIMEGTENRIFPFDLKNISGIEELIKNIVAENGPADGLVHCAGIATMRPLQMTKYDFLHDMMLLNFYSFAELARCISKKTNYAPGCSIVAISSVAARNGLKSKLAYCSSKSALEGAVRSLAAELADKKIRVNCVLPGFIRTEMFDDFINSTGMENFEKNVLSRQYLGVGETADVANAVAFLLGDASKFITGTGMAVDGGYLS
jgi:NAD(P)-dependent dehydrogenase (short-subunit alcohol dehydrogenase family)